MLTCCFGKLAVRAMTREHRLFWETVQTLARAKRTQRNVDLDLAADALELEQLADRKISEAECQVPHAAEPAPGDTGGRG